MKISSISTYTVLNHQTSLRSKMLAESVKASDEAVTGQYYDKGLELGSKSHRYIDNANNIKSFEGMKKNNELVSLRLQTAQTAMGNLIAAGDDDTSSGVLVSFNKTLMGSSSIATPEVLQTSAQNALDSFVSTLNSDYNGDYVFGGGNTTEPPFEYYKAGSGEGASEVVQKAFEVHFGFTVDDAQVANITDEQMTEFVDSEFSALFEEPIWSTVFSKADNTSVTNRISASGEDINISVSANADGFRNAMKNMVLVAEFGNIGLSEGAQTTIQEKARSDTKGTSIGGAIAQITSSSASLGNSESRVSNATKRIDAQLEIFNSTQNDLVEVDGQEAVTRLNALKAMIDLSSAVTKQLMQMSLTNYL